MLSGRRARLNLLLQPNSAHGSRVANRIVGRGPVAAVAGGVMVVASPDADVPAAGGLAVSMRVSAKTGQVS